MGAKSIAKIARHDRVRREIVNRSDVIPSLPEVVTEVLRLLDDPASEIQSFEEPLRNDAALVAKMLKLVNSSFYGVGRPVTKISEAVVVLGFRSLRSMALAASTADFLERDFACYGYDDRGLWHHSLSVASASHRLAAELGEGPNFREEVFVAGLLHDIGKMLLGPYLAEENVDLGRMDQPAHEVELKFLGIDHQAAGAMIGEKWNLSPLVQAVPRYHHDVDSTPAVYARALAVVHLADICAHDAGFGCRDRSRFDVTPSALALQGVGLQQDQWEELVPELVGAMRSALESLGGIGADR